MNEQAMLAVANEIDRSDRLFDMRVFCGAFGSHCETNDRGVPINTGSYMSDSVSALRHSCNTAGCVAGYAAMAAGYTGGSGIEDIALAFLGLDRPTAKRLFICTRGSIWHEVAHEYGWTIDGDGLVDWSEITATQAADVLRRIARGEIKL